MKNKKKKASYAKEKIQSLFALAQENTTHQQRYITLLRKVATRNRTHIPRPIGQSICKHCNIILIPGKTARIRFKRGKNTLKVITCLSCGNIKRIGFTKANTTHTQ
jgi:ribonuclease P protein subunit RPR2